MRVKTFYRLLRSITYFVLFFFCWSYMELFMIPTAIAAQPKQKSKAPGVEKQRPEEKFEAALQSLREQVNLAGEKHAKGLDDSAEMDAIRAKKQELDGLAGEIRAELAQTEKKIAGLSKEILKRYTDFAAYFEKNLKELRQNLDGIEKAAKTDRKAKVEKARLFLEKTQPKKLVQRLDPNRLPVSARKAKAPREPRSKEQYEKDFQPQRKKSSPRTAFIGHEDAQETQVLGFGSFKSAIRMEPALESLYRGQSKIAHKPVLLAFNENEYASDIPISFGAQPASPQFAFSDTAPLLLAQAVDAPTAEYLAETPDVTFSPTIRAKAAELGYSPLRIYEWVRNSIEYAPTYGSIQGADMCLQSKICNDMDTASLLIALLRVSGIYSHYEYSTIEIPIEKAMNWVGGVSDPKMVGTILATNGIPVKVLISGGTIKAVQLEHVYAKAFIDYIPSRGAVHKQGDTFIPLDPSYKQYTYTQGIDIKTAVPFDAQSFANQILSTATTNTVDGSVTNVNSAYVQQTMQDYQTQVQNYIQQNYPNATVGDVIGKKEIIKQEFGILPETLPYKRILLGSEFAQVPDNLRETMSFSIPDQTGSGAGLTYLTSLPQIAGKKITLSFSPATANDQAVIQSLLPQPHADGTPIQPSELPASLPAYLINLKPELRIDGQIVATGSSVTMGSAQPFTMSLNEPGIGMSNIDNVVKAGEYFGIGVDTGRIAASRLAALKAKLDTTKANLEAENYAALTKDDSIGDLLYTTMATYFAELDASDILAARTMNVISYRAPSVGMFSLVLNVKNIFGVPISAGSNAMMMDVDRIMQAVFSKDGNMDAVRRYMHVSGVKSSVLEHAVPEQLFSTATNPVQGISAVKALKIANDQGIPIYTINQANINTILPQLQLNGDANTDIQNAVNAGKEVTVSKTNINFNGWIGCGYIITEPTTGAGAYMISGGANGVWLFVLWASVFLLVCVLGSIGLPYLIAAVIFGTLINFFGSQSILISYGLQNSYNITGQSIAFGIFGIIAGIVLGAGLLALSAAALPTAIFALAAIMLYVPAAIFDFVLFWSKNQIMPLMRRSAYV